MEQKSIEGVVREVKQDSRGVFFKILEDDAIYHISSPPSVFKRTFQPGQTIRGQTIYFFSNDPVIGVNTLEAYSPDGVSLLRYQRKLDSPVSEAHTD